MDLPGYGYAKKSMEEIENWKTIIDYYFEKRYNRISMVFVLIDGRIELQNNDVSLLEWLKSSLIPFCVVLTKVDKLNQKGRNESLEYFKKELLKIGEYMIIPYSSETKEGVGDIIKVLSFLFPEV